MNLFTHPRGAGKGDAIHIHVQRQGRSCFRAVARHHIEDTRRDTRGQGQFGQAQGRQRRFFAGLEHHGIARSQRGGNLPGGHDHGVVPRHDHTDHSHGLALNQGQCGAGGRCDFVVDLVNRLAIPAYAIGRAVHVHRACKLQGFAHVKRFGQREFVGVREQLVGKLDHHALALGRTHAAPAPIFKGDAGGGNRGIDVSRAAAGHRRKHSPVDR